MLHQILLMDDQVKEDGMGRSCNTHGRDNNTYTILVRKQEAKRSLGRIRHRLEDNIRMDLRN
jgi:hypothetical protein